MKRNYRSGSSSQVSMFVGNEVEHTPAFGKRTLFVVGLQTPTEIQDWIEDFFNFEDESLHIKHIYFGANQSFPNPSKDATAIWDSWTAMIKPFLDQHYFCTLDLDVQSVEGLVETPLVGYHEFIPMISVKLPYIQQLGYNATIKLDDKDFQASNPGVWCHSLHNLRTRDSFTNWSQYIQDQILK